MMEVVGELLLLFMIGDQMHMLTLAVALLF
jgi:hypothetical protein